MLPWVLLITSIVLFLFIRAVVHNGRGWLKTREGKGVLFGLFIAPAAALLLGLLGGCSTYGNRAEVFAGIEHTKKLSPQCEQGGADDKLTSNLGFAYRATVSADRRTEVAAVYRHHSCAISSDREQYDAFGVEATRVIYAW